jgi:hypothetical protein
MGDLLKSMPLTTLPKSPATPIAKHRAKVIAGLEEQKMLAKDPNYVRTTIVTIKKDGKKVQEPKRQRVRPWWRMKPDGLYALGIPWRRKLIEFDDGKNAIAVSSLDEIPTMIDSLIRAVRNGELDAQLAQAKVPSST